jgi:hypothetical protein
MLAVLVLLALFVASCGPSPATDAGADPTASTSSTDTTVAPQAEVVGEYVNVLDPYHHEFVDAPNYLTPEAVTLAEGFSLPDFPESIPAQRITSETLPETDLAFVPKPVATGHCIWMRAAADFSPEDVTLGSQDVATAAARDFLAAHGLWDGTYSEPTVSEGSSSSGPQGTAITSWLVRFSREAAAPGLDRYVTVRIGDGDEAVQVSLAIPRLETVEGKLVRLRPVKEVLVDFQAWTDGGSGALQNDLEGVADVEVKGVSLAYVDPHTGDSPLAVPVYRFEVEVRSDGNGTEATGVWDVVAAVDVVRDPEELGTVAAGEPMTSTTLAFPEEMLGDFGFVARWGVGAKNSIDTRAGTVTKDRISQPADTAELELPRESLASLYQDLRAIERTWHVLSATCRRIRVNVS